MKNGERLDPTHWLWETFDEHNDEFFAHRMVVPMPRPGGLWRLNDAEHDARIDVAEEDGVRVYHLGVDAESIDGNRAKARDSLLHEMIHYALLIENGDADAEHGEEFIGFADAVAAQLNLPPCETPGATPEMVALAAANWPKVQRELRRQFLAQEKVGNAPMIEKKEQDQAKARAKAKAARQARKR